MSGSERTDWLGVGRSKEEAVEQIHGLLDQLIQEQDRIMKDLKQENKRLRQQIIGTARASVNLGATTLSNGVPIPYRENSRHPSLPSGAGAGRLSGNLNANTLSNGIAAPCRENSRHTSLLSGALSIQVSAVSRALSDGSCSPKSSPPPTIGSDSMNVLGLRGAGIMGRQSLPGTIDDELPFKVFEEEGKPHAIGKGMVMKQDAPPLVTPTTASFPLQPSFHTQSLALPSPEASCMSYGFDAPAFHRSRRGSRIPTQKTQRSESGLLSSMTQDAIRKLARVTDEEIDIHRQAERFEEELKTRHMGILGLIFRHRLDIEPEHIAKLSPLRAKVLTLISWWVFDAIIGFLIVANAITIGIETSFAAQGHGVPVGIEILEAMFLTVFCTELGMRFYAVGVRVLLSHWVKFDTMLVLCGLLDVLVKVVKTSGPSAVLDQIMLVRMFRLVRLARAARLVVQFRTLWLLVQGLLLSCLPMFYTFGILFSLVYVFAVFGMEIMPVTADYGPEYEAIVTEHFTSIGDAMLVLVQFIFLDSIGPMLRTLVRARPDLCLFFFSFILLGSVSLMNLVTAIMVEGSIRQAGEDQEARKAWEAMKRRQMAPKLRVMFSALDADNSGAITLEEISHSPPELQQQLLHVCNMDDIRETFEMLDYDNSGLVDVDEFVDGVMRVQADKPAELIRLVKQCSDILKKVVLLERRIQKLDEKQAQPAPAPAIMIS